MDSKLAWHIIGVSFRVTRELQDLLPILKEHCGAEEYQDYAQGIARSIHAINTALIDKAIASHPGAGQPYRGRSRKVRRVL